MLHSSHLAGSSSLIIWQVHTFDPFASVDVVLKDTARDADWTGLCMQQIHNSC